MTSDLRAQLQETLGGACDIERELGGGGMSRVFLATETALGRTVVIKVVAPGLLEPLLDHPRLGPLVRKLTLWATRPTAAPIAMSLRENGERTR